MTKHEKYKEEVRKKFRKEYEAKLLKDDTEYFEKKLRMCKTPEQRKRAQKQLDLLNDSIVIYRLTTPNYLRK